MRLWTSFAMSMAAVATLGCTKAVPDFSNLDSSQLPQPLVYGQTRYVALLAVANQTYTFSGTCDLRSKSLAVRELGTSTWYNLSTAPFIVAASGQDDCATSQTFGFSVSDMTTLNGGITPGGPMLKTFEIRSEFEIGPSNASQFVASYSTSIQIKPGQFRLTQGSQSATGSQFKIKARVGPISGGSATGSQFTLTRETK